MGAEPYLYFVPYQENIEAALQELRASEFAAGRYFPAAEMLEFSRSAADPSPGPQHESIADAIEDAGEGGTCSILDLAFLSAVREIGAVTPLEEDVLEQCFHTLRPTRAMIEQNPAFLEDVERGCGIAIVVYENKLPVEIVFAGYSID